MNNSASSCNQQRLIDQPKLIDFPDVDPALLSEAEEIIRAAITSSKIESQPSLIHLCGIPGSGKTTYAGKFVETNPTYALVQFDGVMENLSGYRADRERLGLVDAFKRWELPARVIGYHLFQALIENDRNVFFDHSASFPAHLELIKKVRAKGYAVEMHYLPCPPQVAVRRAREREKLIKRHTPEALIWEREALLKDLIPQYQKLVHRFIEIPFSEENLES